MAKNLFLVSKSIGLGLLLCLWLTPASSQAACPTIDGTFETGIERRVLGLTQYDCDELIIQKGIIDNDDVLEWAPEMVHFYFDGRESCVWGSCWTGKTSSEMVSLLRNNNGDFQDARHGLCSYREIQFKINNLNELEEIHQVFACDDGFQGPIARKWYDLKWGEKN